MFSLAKHLLTLEIVLKLILLKPINALSPGLSVFRLGLLRKASILTLISNIRRKLLLSLPPRRKARLRAR